MRCKYRFAVYGQLKVDTWCPIPVGDVTYQCEPNAIRIVKVISAEFSVADPALWPKGTPSQTPGVKVDFQGLGRRLPEIAKNLRAVEGLLSLYGVERIDLDYPEESWLPDNEAEKAQLEIFSFRGRAAKSPTRRYRLCLSI
jgi:hypothetical protein